MIKPAILAVFAVWLMPAPLAIALEATDSTQISLIPSIPSEHVPSGAQHLLDAEPPHPDILPSGQGSEKEEAKNRILNNTWSSGTP